MESVNSKLIKIRKDVDKSPTEGQKESGNYKKGHISINGFKITIENPKGSYRKGVDSNGREWKTKMNNDYGYFLNSEGYDGDHVDVFLGSNFDSDKIFVVDQKKGNKFDESKVMLGFNTEKEAKNAYLSNYEKGWNGFHKITEVPINNFKEWLYDGKKQRKPFYQYKDNKKNTKKMKINESTLRNLIRECIKKVVMKEYSVIKEDIKSAFTNLLSNSDLTTIPKKQVQMVNINGKNFWGIVFDKKTIDDSINFQEKIHDFLSKNPQLQLVTIDGDSAVIINKNAKEDETLNINENNEHFNEESIYTMENWNNDGTLKPKVNQLVDNEVIEELANSVPPTTYKSTCFQPGEAYSHSEEYIPLYMTFVNKNGMWMYIGLCPKGTTKQVPEMRFETTKRGNTINEGKRGLNSPKLFQLAKEHGGLSPKHGYSFRRFNELTDDDVIGVIEKPELNRYENASWKTKQEWAEQKGFTVNKGDEVEFIPLSDWSWVAVIVRGGLLPNKEWEKTPYGEKITNRNKNKINNGSRHYVWSDTDTHGVEGLKGWSKRANEFSMKKYNNDVKNSQSSKK